MLGLSFDNSPIHWTDPKTWPWVVYEWIAFLLFGLLVSLWRWLQRTRVASWPIASGRIDSIAITKPRFFLNTKRDYYVAELRYSYSVAGSNYSRRYKRKFPTEQEAAEFVRDLEGKSVVVHYPPNSPSRSLLSEPDVENMLQNRSPIPESEKTLAAPPVPEWVTPYLRVFVWLSAIGLVASVCVHIAAITGHPVSSLFWIFHVGIFVVWFPAILVAQRLVGSTKRKDFWKAVLKGSPDWMRYMVYGFFAYAFVNFMFFMTNAPSDGNGMNTPPSMWQGFSGHWMAFYSAALAILYSATRIADAGPRCVNGHLVSPTAVYCSRCGQPVTRIR
jgi:hypothetical protein